MIYLAIAGRFLIGVIFAFSALGKVRSKSAYREFVTWLADLPVPLLPKRGRAVVAGTLVADEVLIVVLVTMSPTAPAGLSLAAVTLAVFAAGTFAMARSPAQATCQCFGRSEVPISTRHLVRDIVLCAVAATAAAAAAAATVEARPVGITMSLASATVAAAFLLLLDDIAALFADPAADPAGGSPRG
jgi:hypothetical protein